MADKNHAGHGRYRPKKCNRGDWLAFGGVVLLVVTLIATFLCHRV